MSFGAHDRDVAEAFQRRSKGAPEALQRSSKRVPEFDGYRGSNSFSVIFGSALGLFAVLLSHEYGTVIQSKLSLLSVSDSIQAFPEMLDLMVIGS